MSQPSHVKDSDNWILEAVERYQSQLIAYASKILYDRDLAREVVQDAFMKLCSQKRSDVQGKLQAWLYRVVRNRSLNLKRKDKRMIHGMQQEQMESLGSRQSSAMRSGVFELIQLLPDRQSELLLLKFAEGLSYQEISAVTGLTTSNVGYLLHHAVKALKQLWDEVESGK